VRRWTFFLEQAFVGEKHKKNIVNPSKYAFSHYIGPSQSITKTPGSYSAVYYSISITSVPRNLGIRFKGCAKFEFDDKVLYNMINTTLSRYSLPAHVVFLYIYRWQVDVYFYITFTVL